MSDHRGPGDNLDVNTLRARFRVHQVRSVSGGTLNGNHD